MEIVELECWGGPLDGKCLEIKASEDRPIPDGQKFLLNRSKSHQAGVHTLIYEREGDKLVFQGYQD